jgi:hypothetical protein
MSPVVQQLEQMAVSGHSQRTASVSTTQSFLPPPPSQQPGTSATPTSPPATQQTFAPVAYNPAAPAAPEQRAHREKTPPPPDADTGTGLGGAAQHDQPAYYGGGPPQGGFGPQQGSYMPGPQRTNTVGSIPGPPQSGSPYQQSFAGPPQAATPQQQDPNAHLYAQQPGTPGLQRQSTYPYQPGPGVGAPAQSPPPPQQQYANYPSAVASAQGPPQPQTPSYAPVQSPAQQTSYGQAPAQSQGGYGQYNPASTQHAMHGQFYTPEGSSTPAIAGPGAHAGKPQYDPSRLDGVGQRLEKGVGKFLKRLDKKI